MDAFLYTQNTSLLFIYLYSDIISRRFWVGHVQVFDALGASRRRRDRRRACGPHQE